ncbi:prephenate dehydratase, partial [bacterium]|nr:prephenate dehydratase [bacterium]
MTHIAVENIYYLGPDGSNSYNAMEKFVDVCSIAVNNKIAQKSIKDALEALKQDYSSVCVLPIENSIEGIVRETIDNLLKVEDSKIKIQGELSLPIMHLLLARGTDISKITKVISHPQALAQCGRYLYENFKDAELKDVSSTSYAAQKVAQSEDNSLAAIANESCANLFGLNILAQDLNDEKDNKTRFYLLGRDVIDENKQNGKTAIVLSTKNKSGALCDVLKIFAKHELNLTYIDSRPSKRQLGEYLFFMELDGLETEYRVKMALEELMSYVNFVRVLGSFSTY